VVPVHEIVPRCRCPCIRASRATRTHDLSF